jgi:plasmid maintenance system antidote protein VapI
MSMKNPPWRLRLSELVNEKRGIPPEMVVRLSQVFGGSAEGWLVHRRNAIFRKFAPTG